MNKEFNSLMKAFDESDNRFDRLTHLTLGLYALLSLILICEVLWIE